MAPTIKPTQRSGGILARREADVMAVVWERGETTAQEVREWLDAHGKRLRESTVRTMLRLLEKKGYVRHRQEGRTFIYAPLISRETARAAALEDLAQRLFGGSMDALRRYLAAAPAPAAPAPPAHADARKRAAARSNGIAAHRPPVLVPSKRKKPAKAAAAAASPPFTARRRDKRRGFSFLSILLALMIIGTLGGTAFGPEEPGGKIMPIVYLDRTQKVACDANRSVAATQLASFQINHGHSPTREDIAAGRVQFPPCPEGGRYYFLDGQLYCTAHVPFIPPSPE